MIKTIREEVVGKTTLRLLQRGESYVGLVIGGKGVEQHEGEDPEQLWAKLRAEVGKASPAYFGYNGARRRFLRLFPDGFGKAYEAEERTYKVAASDYLRDALPLDRAREANADDWEAAARAYAKTNLLSTFEQARTRELLKSKDGRRFIAAAAALADGDSAAALPEIARLFRPFGTPSWPAATYLPFLWRPSVQMFLKPEVTKDFAERVGHRFCRDYGSKLDPKVHSSLLDLAKETAVELKDLAPRDMIDVQSFIWVVGAYTEDDAAALSSEPSRQIIE